MTPEVVIGLEVHAQLLTQSKMFCGCTTAFGAAPNTQTCPVCLGMPGVLPVINRKAVEFAIRTGLALHCTIAPQNRFARKNYFYPDLPKGYQISQYELPICEHGWLDIGQNGTTKRVRIRRAHLEEDAGKNLHEGIAGASHVDLNRAGTPLLEIVTEPDLGSPEEAIVYLKSLRDILVYLEVCDGNMEEGSLRCEPNLSLRPAGSKELGTKVELKNINSFRFAKAAMGPQSTRVPVRSTLLSLRSLLSSNTSARSSGTLDFNTGTGTLQIRNLATTGRATMDVASGNSNTGANVIGRPSMGSWITYGLGSQNSNLPTNLTSRSKTFFPSSSRASRARLGRQARVAKGR